VHGLVKMCAVVCLIFEEPVTLSLLKLWNYSKVTVTASDYFQ
jgi:hypothetical protein